MSEHALSCGINTFPLIDVQHMKLGQIWANTLQTLYKENKDNREILLNTQNH